MYKHNKINMYSTAINLFLFLTSLSTATGILLHDTRIDKAATVAALPATISAEVGAKMVHAAPNDLHTHVERASVGHAVSLLHASPSLMPRVHEDKKHLMQRYVSKGHHAFDNYNLPIV